MRRVSPFFCAVSLLLSLVAVSPAWARDAVMQPVKMDEVTAAWNKAETVYRSAGLLRDGRYTAAVGSFCGFLDGYCKGYKYRIYKEYFLSADGTFLRLQNAAKSLYDVSVSADEVEIGRARFHVMQALSDWETVETSSQLWTNSNYFIIVSILISLLLVFAGTVLFYVIQLEKSKMREIDSSALNAQILRAQEDERSRLSRELHDTVAQDMKYTALLAGKISDDRLSAEIRSNQDKCIDEIRVLCYNLSPPDINAGDLLSAMELLCGTFKKSSGLDVRLTIPDGTDFSFLGYNNTLNVYRLVQECLNNIAHHAQATEVTVLLRSNNDGTALALFITDDGCGMDSALVKQLNAPSGRIMTGDGCEHFGVRGMKERVRMLGGTIVFNSLPGEGTEVAITVPHQS